MLCLCQHLRVHLCDAQCQVSVLSNTCHPHTSVMPGAEQHLPCTCRMAALYSHLSEHVHELDRNAIDAVIICRELVNSGQAQALKCIADSIKVAVQIGLRRRRTHDT